MPSLNERKKPMTFQETISAYIQERYQITPDFPFKKHPDYLVFRHPRNAKWFALIMPPDAQLLGATENKQLTILTVKFAPELIALLKNQPGYFPAYHMNKEHWLSLSEEIPLSQVFSFIDESYQRSY
ncbi:MAG: MmcQ/YjbR family DNA-binding protein [Enterococcus faecalis]|nr:MmcQ/YjbR family DNA-binding protein [Enterococcus faecalis]